MPGSRVTPLEADYPFEIIAHWVPVVPFREYPHAIIDEQQGLGLSVKQYVPRHSRPSGASGEPLTIVAAGGLGFIKELYEPLFAALLSRADQAGVAIRAIWIADMFNVGQSAVANRANLGCDPSWLDHSRDLWSLIHHFRADMPKPLVGLGHSMGCTQLVALSAWHPTLFHSLAFIEPGLDVQYGRGITVPWSISTLKQGDCWASRAEAETGAVRLAGAQRWDPRVRTRLTHYGIYEIPPAQAQGAPWALTNPKDQIAALASRLNKDRIGLGPGGLETVTLEQRQTIPDSDPDGNVNGQFYRHELKTTWDMLPKVRPWVLYINGGKSPFFGHPGTREQRLHLTGTGPGGNGGVRLGAVTQRLLEDGEHTMVFDKNMATVAEYVAVWLADESARWMRGPKTARETWQARPMDEKQTVGPDYMAALASQIKDWKRPSKM
ncbi:hypothetical protein N7462_010010 [Penicillium macrosclerotiorum]|uniref:uncharacterized protein n=1 Tax=Penicillium macrosclerotiorum TaxID=303699 RepID=UPI002548DE52|nr:uncharacterized protein N7462_010010 [Penicillium macrosclerotiorum]KAJ5668940.1 hypothetical protein N7462_010010 [Penicillium macrosclerotiorum]